MRHRRAIIAGEINELQAKIDWRKEQLRHIDATLGIFGSEPDKRAIKPYHRVKLFGQGELAGAVRAVLRRNGKPLSTAEVVAGVMAEFGHDERTLGAMGKRVRSSLEYLRKDKRAVTSERKGRLTLWVLVKE